MLDNLQLLDLEGNDVDDLVQVQYLSLCLKLQTLTLEGNPVCVRQNPTFSKVGKLFSKIFIGIQIKNKLLTAPEKGEYI